jgi:hypothetical protein
MRTKTAKVPLASVFVSVLHFRPSPRQEHILVYPLRAADYFTYSQM